MIVTNQTTLSDIIRAKQLKGKIDMTKSSGITKIFATIEARNAKLVPVALFMPVLQEDSQVPFRVAIDDLFCNHVYSLSVDENCTQITVSLGFEEGQHGYDDGRVGQANDRVMFPIFEKWIEEDDKTQEAYYHVRLRVEIPGVFEAHTVLSLTPVDFRDEYKYVFDYDVIEEPDFTMTFGE